MDVFLIKATQLIVALALLVIIHEFGHFLFARIFGIRVEKFYIFFNPWISIAKWHPKRYFGFFNKKKKLKGAETIEAAETELLKAEEIEAETALQNARREYGVSDPAADVRLEEKAQKKAAKSLANSPYRKKRGFWTDTEYGLGWVPLGGYCKIAGMIDESMDTEQMAKPAKHWEFRAKPAWQRLLVMIAGVLFNFLLAILIYAGIVYATGEKYVPVNKAEMGFAYSEAARKAGFRNGDIPLMADGKKLDERPAEARTQLLEAQTVIVLRNNDSVTIRLPKDFIFRLEEEAKSDTAEFSFLTYRIPAQIIQVVAGEGADKGGIKVGDRILAVDSIPTPSLDLFKNTLNNYPDKDVAMTVLRPRNVENAIYTAAEADTLMLTVHLNQGAKMGVGLEVDPSKFYESKEIHYNIIESVPRGIELGTSTLTSYVKSMKHVFTKEGAQSIGGFGAIGSIFPEKWNWIAFWNIAAFLSVALAFMNILPIPALDGGHVLFLLAEVITGRKPSLKFMEAAQWVGMILLLSLLIYANGMDIYRFFIK